MQIDENLGLFGKELFAYRSGSINEQISHFLEYELEPEFHVGS